MGDLSEHFDRHEFRDRRTGAVMVDPHLVEHLERLRALIERPLPIVSGYRSRTTNRAVGGGRRSQHLYGRAADIPPELATLDQALEAGFTGIGLAGDWVTHVDVRPGRVTVWRYS